MTDLNKASELARSVDHPSLMPIHVGSVTLLVIDLPRVSEWYQSVLGLVVRQSSATEVVLGTSSKDLLKLRGDRKAVPAHASAPGLFHNAFLVPSRTDLAIWLTHVAHIGVPLSGASDHGVSEAVYLDDPEGNGIEVYADRTREAWPKQPDGSLNFPSRPLDLQAMMADAHRRDWQGAPDGTVLGHLHLKIGNLNKARIFFVDLLGMETRNSLRQAEFYASGGYHHHIAANTFQSAGRSARVSNAAGLTEYTLSVHNTGLLSAISDRFAEADLDCERSDAYTSVVDPWGARVRLVAEK